MDNFVSREEHEEFARRMEDAHRRQDKRLSLLEESVRQIGALTTSVEKLALSVQAMGETLAAQNGRLEELEGRDGARWRQAVSYVATTVIGLLLGFLASQIGLT